MHEDAASRDDVRMLAGETPVLVPGGKDNDDTLPHCTGYGGSKGLASRPEWRIRLIATPAARDNVRSQRHGGP